ncbi:MAG: universal stress protein [Nitrospira sp.]|nr:universal stress protein [Nitrospira sp.]
MRIERILLATDFSSWARRAEDYACSLASLWNARLTIMSVLELVPGMNPDYPVNHQYLTERMRETSEQLAECKRRIEFREIFVSARIGTGLPSEEVVAAALAEDSDLVVLGTRGRSGLAHVLLGSTAERVIRTAPCPVLAVHLTATESSTPRPEITLERILVPIDFFDGSLDALEYAALLARQTKASIKVLHVLEPVAYGLDFTLGHAEERERTRERLMKRLDALSTALTAAGIPATSLIRGGIPGDTILDEARTWPGDLLVMGTHGRRGISHVLSGSIAEAVLRRAECPVLTVRNPKFHPSHQRVTLKSAL